jgi:hypothetical protein
LNTSRGIALAALLSSCGGDVLVRVDISWPEDQVAVLLVTKADGSVLEGPRILETTGLTKIDVAGELDFRVHVVTFLTKENGGPDIEGCGLTVRGEGQRLIDYFTGYYVSEELSSEESRDLALSPAPIAESMTLGLSFDQKSCATAYPCELVQVQQISAGFTNTLAPFVEAIDRTRAVAVLQISPEEPVHVLLIDGPSSDRIAEVSDYGVVTGLAYDHRGEIFLTTEAGWVLTLALDGTITSTLSRGGIARSLGVAAAGDGTVALYGDIGIDVIDGDLTQAEAAKIESTTLDVMRLAFDSKSRALALANAALNFFDGESWVVERENQAVVFEDFFALAIGEDQALVAGKDEDVFRRNEAMGTWSQVQPHDVLSPVNLRGAAALGGDTFMVAGDAGYVGIYRNGVWCQVPTGVTNAIDALSITEDGRVAYAVGRPSVQTQNRPLLIRLQLAE